MKSLSEITNGALDEITRGKFIKLPKSAMTGLLNDFQYSWLRRFEIPYKFSMLDAARALVSGNDKVVFKATRCKSVEDIRNKFSAHIKKRYETDDRVILSLTFDGKNINAEWVEMEKYLQYCNGNSTED